MKKILRKIIGAFIYSDGLRRAIRGIDLPGQPHQSLIKEYFKFSNHFRKYFKDEENINFPYNLSLVLIIKDEASYIEEWINYHRIVGVNHFFIYDNESNDNLYQLLKPYIDAGIVDYIFWKGKQQQLNAYNHAIHNFKLKTKWLGFIDSDEFIVPIEKKTIPEVLEDIKPKWGLQINWCMYGDNNQEIKTDEFVIKRFTKHAKLEYPSNKLCKQIINPRAVYFVRAHDAYFIKNNHSIDENGKKAGTFSKKPSMNKIRINHYYTKSKEEFLNKIKRSDVIFGNLNSKLDDFYNINKGRNDIEDDIMEKYIPLIKDEIKKFHN